MTLATRLETWDVRCRHHFVCTRAFVYRHDFVYRHEFVYKHDFVCRRDLVCRQKFVSKHHLKHATSDGDMGPHISTLDILSSDIFWDTRCRCLIGTCDVGLDTGWRRFIGCLKLQVIFRKRAANYRALLRKMSYEDKASYDSTPLCIISVLFRCVCVYVCLVFWNMRRRCLSYCNRGHCPQKSPIISGSFAENDL